MANGAMPAAWKQALLQALVPALHGSGCRTALPLPLHPSVCPCVASILCLAVSSSCSCPHRALLLFALPDLYAPTVEPPALPLQLTTGFSFLFVDQGTCKPGVRPTWCPQRMQWRKKRRCGHAMGIGLLRRHCPPAKVPNLDAPSQASAGINHGTLEKDCLLAVYGKRGNACRLEAGAAPGPCTGPPRVTSGRLSLAVLVLALLSLALAPASWGACSVRTVI